LCALYSTHHCQRPAARNFSVLQHHLLHFALRTPRINTSSVWYSLLVVGTGGTVPRNLTAIVSLWIVIKVGQTPLTGLKSCKNP
jgi:hypothetical protein